MMNSDASVKGVSRVEDNNKTQNVPLAASQEPVKEDQSTSALSNGWKYWKKRQGSAEHANRKMSSIDPLAIPDAVSQRPANIPPVRSEPAMNSNAPPSIKDNNEQLHINTSQHEELQPTQVGWSKWLNPMNYIPEQAFNFPVHHLPSTGSQHLSDSQSTHSSLTSATPTDSGWFGWVWGPKKQSDEALSHDLISSIELKKNLKEAKKAIQSPDSVWAWYQNHYNDRIDGELSVLDTKTETSPVELTKYPGNLKKNEGDKAVVVPDFKECFREITTKTKIRIATQLYYNYPTEEHLYIKKNVHKPLIRYVLVVSVVGNLKGAKSTISAKSLSSLAVESVKDWYSNKETSFDYQVESISLEAAKMSEESSEDLFKLLINWREDFKKIDHLYIVGYNNSVPLAAKLLDILIARNHFENARKFGLLSLDGLVPGPYLEEADTPNISYCTDFNETLTDLIENHNVKMSIVGTQNNIPGSLAIHLRHPNIFRSLYIPTASYDNEFEIRLFQILLMAHNLGHSSTRLLIQLNKYFTSQANILEDLNTQFYANAAQNSLSTTTLIHGKKVTQDIVKDSILDNEYNLIWTLHAFIDDFKKIKNINAHSRVVEFIEAYKRWDPQSKSLKELKFMLEVLRVDDYSNALLRR